MSDHPSHITRMSDSSFYDEKCVLCGGTDGSGDHSLLLPCPEGRKHHASHQRKWRNMSVAPFIFVWCADCEGNNTKGGLAEPCPGKFKAEEIKTSTPKVGKLKKVKTSKGEFSGTEEDLRYILKLIERDVLEEMVGPQHITPSGNTHEDFVKDLTTLINCYSIDAKLNLPDNVLAEYVSDMFSGLARMEGAMRGWTSIYYVTSDGNGGTVPFPVDPGAPGKPEPEKIPASPISPTDPYGTGDWGKFNTRLPDEGWR